MSYLTLNIPSDTVEIVLKNSRGSINKIDVTATLNSAKEPKSIKVMSGELQTNADRDAAQQDILDAMEVERMLPSALEISQRIRAKEDIEKVQINSLENIERDADGLPKVSELRKFL